MRILVAMPLLLAVACSSGTTQSDAGDDAVATNDSPASDTSTTDGDTDTWLNYAQGFFATYCTSCHNASDTAGLDFTMQPIVETNKATIRCGVCVTQDPSWNCPASPPAQQFPIGTGPKPSNTERDRIVAWISAGAP